MVLSTAERAAVAAAAYMRERSRTRTPIPLTKSDLQAAINTLPVAARTNLTSAEKARLLAEMALKKFDAEDV